MPSTLNPYLSFRDNAREALEFYQSVFGGVATINTFADFHASEEPDEQNLVMHGQLETTAGFTLMACRMAPPSRCRSRRQCGATSSACSLTGSVLPG